MTSTDTPPPAVDATAIPTAIEQAETDPSLASLKAMFPDIDPVVLKDIYVNHNSNADAVAEFLLTNQPAAPNQEDNAGPSQLDLDEQLARQLEQEELSSLAGRGPRAHQWQAQQRPAQAQEPTNQGPNTNTSANNDDLQEQFAKLAETGKRTFSSLFNKVREKIKEFDAPPPGAGTSSGTTAPSAPSPAPWATASYAPVSLVTADTQPAPSAPAVHPPVASSSGSQPPPVTSAPVTAPEPPHIDVSKVAFLEKKPTPLTEAPRTHTEEDLTENPFDDRRN